MTPFDTMTAAIYRFLAILTVLALLGISRADDFPRLEFADARFREFSKPYAMKVLGLSSNQVSKLQDDADHFLTLRSEHQFCDDECLDKQAINPALNAFIETITPQKYHRLGEIVVQSYGCLWIRDDEMQDVLRMTDVQASKVQTTMDNFRRFEDMLIMRYSLGELSKADMLAQFEGRSLELRSAKGPLARILTKAQLKQLVAMGGKPIAGMRFMVSPKLYRGRVTIYLNPVIRDSGITKRLSWLDKHELVLKPNRTQSDSSSSVNSGHTALPSQSFAVIETSQGPIVAKLLPNRTPDTFRAFAFLAREGSYDGVRVVRILRPCFEIGDSDLERTSGRWWDMRKDLDTDTKLQGARTASAADVRIHYNVDQGRGYPGFFIFSSDGAGAYNNSYNWGPKFGEVIEGMDVVRRISAITPDNQNDGSISRADAPTIKRIRVTSKR